MRKKGVIALLIFVLIIFLISYFTRNFRIEKMIESIGSSIVGAKVELDNFRFSLLKMECSWDRLQIANKNNPWKNAIETGTARFKLETRPLFWRRIIIKEMSLENVRTGTARETDGSLPKKEQKPAAEPSFFIKAKASLDKELASLPVFDLSGLGKKLKIDSLIDVKNLQTVQAYESLEKSADSTFQFWKSQLKTQTYADRLKTLENKIKTLKIEQMRDVQGLTQGLNKIKDIQKEARTLKTEITEKHSALTNDFKKIEEEVTLIQKSLQKDIDRAKQLAHLRELNVQDVSRLLFGDVLINRVQEILHYVALARKYIPAKKSGVKPEKQKPPRLKGQDIDFPFHYRYPKFLLRKASFSAATAAGDTQKAFFFDGTLFDLTNQPAISAMPTRLSLMLKKFGGNVYEIKGAFDHIGEIPYDTLNIRAKNFALGKIALKKQKYFPTTLKAEKGDVSLSGLFIGDNINLSLTIDAKPINFIFENPGRDKVSQIVRDVLAGVNQLKLNARLQGKSSALKLNMNSNVDKVLATQVQATLAKNIREAQLQLENFVRNQANQRKARVDALIEKNRSTIYKEIDDAKAELDKKIKEIEENKKQIEKKLEEEKKKLEEKAKNKLKSLFKKP